MSDKKKKHEKRNNQPPPIPKRRCTNEQIMSALEKSAGNISKAARILGYKPNSLRLIIANDEELLLFKQDVIETRLDKAENKLDEHIYEKNSLHALEVYLKAVGKYRGYGAAPIDINIQGKIQHSVDEEILKGLIDKFEDQLKDDDGQEGV
jgi:hypothetical protein